MEKHYRHSSFREKLVEHLFVGELLKHSWLRGECSLEVARPEVDNRGYDVIIERRGVVRHIQLKASYRAATAAGQKVHVGLAEKPAGCVVWIQFDERTMALGPYLFFGGEAGAALPSLDGLKIARHTKANAAGMRLQRPDIRVVPKSRFRRIDTVDRLFELLFERVGGTPGLRAIEVRFHALIAERVVGLAGPSPLPPPMPVLAPPLPSRSSPAWLPVDGMYGGFRYWLEEHDGRHGLVVESWSRVIGGSGQRHRIEENTTVLLASGFV